MLSELIQKDYTFIFPMEISGHASLVIKFLVTVFEWLSNDLDSGVYDDACVVGWLNSLEIHYIFWLNFNRPGIAIQSLEKVQNLGQDRVH